MNNDVTICIKSFERPNSLEVCIQSFRKYYDLPIIVADDSFSHSRKKIIDICKEYDCHLIMFEPDSGIGVCRNALIQSVSTPYIFQSDDDIICDRRLKIRRLYNQVAYDDFDIIAPILKEHNKIVDFYVCHYEKDRDEENQIDILWCKYGPNDDGQYHFTSNVWLGKTDVVKNIKWDEKIKVGGQHDWFLKCWLNNIKIGVNRYVTAINTHNHQNLVYKKMRNRLSYNDDCMMEWSKELGSILRFINKDGQYDEWSNVSEEKKKSIHIVNVEVPKEPVVEIYSSLTLKDIDFNKAFQPMPDCRFISFANLIEDTKKLIAKIPQDVTSIMGVARSGMLPASILACMLHLPLNILRTSNRDWIDTGYGWRLQKGQPQDPGITLVVDDVVMTGGSTWWARKILKDIPNKIHVAVYCNPNATFKPDIWSTELYWPHLLEWNLFNSILSEVISTDFDGVLCEDCPVEDDDDGPRYIRFLKNVKPKYLTRRRNVKLIVTARTEKYRDLTLDWLDKWGIEVDRLEMREDRKQNIVEFKAKHVKQFLDDAMYAKTFNERLQPRIFIESDPRQADAIARLTGGLIVCPTNYRCYQYDI